MDDLTSIDVRADPPRLATLVIAASVGPLAMNVFLPSLPHMSAHFSVPYSVIQLVVSLYLVALAAVQLLIGPASDRFGRRPILLGSFVIFIIATVAAIYAPNIQVLLACRVMQSFSAAGFVLARAIVRDTVDTERTASQIGYVTMGMALTPMIAPFVGGYLDELYGWQASFWLSAIFGVIALVIVWIDLSETNLYKSSSIGAQFRSYPELFRSPRFWGYTLTAMFASGVFFAFLGGGPFVSTEMLHLTPSQYGFYFGIISIGYMLGNFVAGRYSQAIGINRMMLYGNLIMCLGLVICIALFAAGYWHPLSLFGSASFIGIGNGMTLPNANAGIVSVRPHLAGSASGLGGALTMAGAAALAAIAASILTVETGPYPMLFMMLMSAIAATLTSLLVMQRTEAVGEL